jgi:predicted RNA binding protein YcfA (HicA-like mRNA interferase family)
MKASELIKLLRKNGFHFDRQAKGSHEIWVNDETKRTTIVSNHGARE